MQTLAVLTSGGDSPGMNAAVRAVVRTALAEGRRVFAVFEGLQGLVDGGARFREMSSADVSGILQAGGTVLGTARSADFRTRDGRRRAARNILEHGVDGLVVIGGDGSLSGADELRTEWPDLLEELVADGSVDRATADAHLRLALVGLVGSIDNDMFGTDMTIGADTALHRITEAVDAIQSTASSHQRTFVIEVMGRRCGYLALMAGLATGATSALIPEQPSDDWDSAMCDVVRSGRAGGRRASVIIVAEGARDVAGQDIDAPHVKRVLEERLGEDVRVTLLGHVQRGGAPSAFDRYLGTLLGHAAVLHLAADPAGPPQVLGIRGHKLTASPLADCVAQTRNVADVIEAGDYQAATQLRGGSFAHSVALLRTLVQARPRRPDPGSRGARLAILHAGEPAPGMNTAVRVALRVGMNHGHTVLGVADGFRGLAAGAVDEMGWMTASGWVSRPGADLGTSRRVPGDDDLDAIAGHLDAHRIDGLLVVGGWAGYVAAHAMEMRAADDERLAVPIVCVPASIDNDLPASDLSIGADTALNSIVSDVDKIKQSAGAAQRCFVVEVMGNECGYLATLSALATGAERVHVPEEELTLERLQTDLAVLRSGFAAGKRRGLVIRSEQADAGYTTSFVTSLFARESNGQFEVRSAVLGHVQQGGSPSPFDRIQASRLAAAGIEELIAKALAGERTGTMVGLRRGRIELTPLATFPDLIEADAARPRDRAWWAALRPLVDLMGQPDLR